MNASEIESIEARLQAGLHTLPSPEQLERIVANVRQERNREMAASIVRFVERVIGFAGEVRKIAKACTDARLHLPSV